MDASLIRFRPLQASDLSLLHRWFNKPHVLEWWGDEWGGTGPAYEQVAAKYTPRIEEQSLTASYVFLYAGMPVGYIQTYRIWDYPDYAAAIGIDDDAAGIDLFIGEEAYLHKGLGPRVLTRFLDEIVFRDPHIESCIIGPEVANKAAIRAYEKAGFSYVKTVRVPDEPQPEYVMRLHRDEVGGGQHATGS